MRLILYGFHICPFVEQSKIILIEKNILCEHVHVNIRNKPNWFLKLSPLGKVPILSANDTLIFESNVINEFLDETSLPSLHPSDPIQKAYNKSWIEWGNKLIFDAYNMTIARDKTSFLELQRTVGDKLSLLENQVKTPYFNGNYFSLIDVTYAPLFFRFKSLAKQFSLDLLKKDFDCDLVSEYKR